jgi:restriction system protein
LYGLMAAQRMAGGFVVTSGDFTDEARRFAKGREVELINGRALQRNLRAQAPRQSPEATVLPAPASVPEAAHPPSQSFAATQPMGLEAATSPPPAASGNACPVCGAAMVLRQARTGSHAGQSFWGCTEFAKTRCRGTRPAQQ